MNLSFIKSRLINDIWSYLKGRGLAYEGLAQWQDSLNDYNAAIRLWGGQASSQRDPKINNVKLEEYDGINPYVLTFRGNALSRLVSTEFQL